jgi:4-amino-4-deoxy-L-arabinose transferase-like glycosyltransferase
LAAVAGWATQALLPFHDGARLASALFGGLALAFLSGAARRLYGSDAAWGAPLLAIGTLGLLVPLHEAQPAAAVLASLAAVYWGAALLNERPLAGALLMGGGLGASFLAGGLGGVLPGLTLLAIPLWERRWSAFLIALGLGIAVAGSWPLTLWQQNPSFLSAWWTAEAASITPRGWPDVDHLKFLGWFAWPVLFIAPWAFWRNRRRLSDTPLALPLIGATAALLWFLMYEPKDAALPLLPPLILLAASGTERLRRGAANAWDWFGMITFTIVTALVWLAASAMFTNWPPKIASNITKLEPGFVAQFSLPAMLAASAATIAWIAVLLRLPRSPWRVANRWAAGVTVMWVLVVALLMPWIDYGKTYRPVVTSLAKALPADPGCIGRRHLGATQRAALDYFVGIRTRYGLKGCEWLIIQGGKNETVPAGWTKAWEGHRPGDRSEWLRLYKRD